MCAVKFLFIMKFLSLSLSLSLSFVVAMQSWGKGRRKRREKGEGKTIEDKMSENIETHPYGRKRGPGAASTMLR